MPSISGIITLDKLMLFWANLKLILRGKVDAVDGKGLSTNDYTNADMLKLSGIETGAQANVLEGIQVNGSNIVPVSKIANVSVPEAYTLSPTMNGTSSAGSSTSWSRGDHIHPHDTTRAPLESPSFTGTPTVPTAPAGTNTTQIATTEFVTRAISRLGNIFDFKGNVSTVGDLPVTGSAGDVYRVIENGVEYYWNEDESEWEPMGGELIDTSAFYQTGDLTVATSSQIEAMFNESGGG